MSLCSSCFHPPSFIDIIDQDDFTEITTLGSVVGRLSKTRKDPPVAVIENVEYTEDVRSMTDELRTAVDNANKYSLEQLQALFREAARMQHLADQHLNEKVSADNVFDRCCEK